MSNQKKVLVITYYWPPAGGPGVQRVLKFVKYLPEFGWQPIIMTVENGDYPATDHSLLSEIPAETKIYKIPIWEPYQFYRKLSGQKTSQAIPVAVLTQKENLSPAKRIMHWIRANLFIPDARIGWYFSAVKKAQDIIRSENIDLIFVSTPPHSLQLIGKKLKRLTALPLISDMRDPWTDIHYYQNVNRSSVTKKLDRRLESSALCSADVVTTVSPDLKRLFESKCPGLDCRVIYNGFDEPDFADIPSKTSGKFVLSYIGNFKANQNITILWEVLAELVQENKLFRENFCLEFTGKTNPDTILSINKNHLDSFTVITDYIPHREAIVKMQSASVLLFIIPESSNNKGILTGKLFDYLASGVALLSIGPPGGDAATLLNEVGAGPVFDYKGKTEIKKYLLKLYQAWNNNQLEQYKPDNKLVKKFGRKPAAQKISEIMNDLIKAS